MKMNKADLSIQGDLIKLAQEGVFDLIVHGCNCFCSMDAGIARQIKETFIEAYKVDLATKKGDREKLGTISFAEIGNLIIVNAYTQYHYSGSTVLLDYEALRNCLRTIKNQFAGRKIGLPKIGAGLAGGDWNKILTMIREELQGEQWQIVEYSRQIKKK